jgi:hypothetical protein
MNLECDHEIMSFQVACIVCVYDKCILHHHYLAFIYV